MQWVTERCEKLQHSRKKIIPTIFRPAAFRRGALRQFGWHVSPSAFVFTSSHPLLYGLNVQRALLLKREGGKGIGLIRVLYNFKSAAQIVTDIASEIDLQSFAPLPSGEGLYTRSAGIQVERGEVSDDLRDVTYNLSPLYL